MYSFQNATNEMKSWLPNDFLGEFDIIWHADNKVPDPVGLTGYHITLTSACSLQKKYKYI
jgi:hypothetical protein